MWSPPPKSPEFVEVADGAGPPRRVADLDAPSPEAAAFMEALAAAPPGVPLESAPADVCGACGAAAERDLDTSSASLRTVGYVVRCPACGWSRKEDGDGGG